MKVELNEECQKKFYSINQATDISGKKIKLIICLLYPKVQTKKNTIYHGLILLNSLESIH